MVAMVDSAWRESAGLESVQPFYGRMRASPQRDGAGRFLYGDDERTASVAPTQSMHVDIHKIWRSLRALNISDTRSGMETVKQKLQFGRLDVAEGCYGDLLALHAMLLAL